MQTIQAKKSEGGWTYACAECKNDNTYQEEKMGVGDIVECKFCGTEYEVAKVEGVAVTLQIIEEEK